MRQRFTGNQTCHPGAPFCAPGASFCALGVTFLCPGSPFHAPGLLSCDPGASFCALGSTFCTPIFFHQYLIMILMILKYGKPTIPPERSIHDTMSRIIFLKVKIKISCALLLKRRSKYSEKRSKQMGCSRVIFKNEHMQKMQLSSSDWNASRPDVFNFVGPCRIIGHDFFFQQPADR